MHVERDSGSKTRHVAAMIGGGCIALGLAHAGALALYLLPANPLSKVTADTAGRYIHHLWHQDWHLFSPHVPTSTSVLNVACRDDEGESTGWLDASSRVISDSFNHPMGADAKMRYVYNGVHDQLVNTVVGVQIGYCGEQPKGEENSSPAYQACVSEYRGEIDAAVRRLDEYDVAIRFARHACEERLDGDIARIELRSVERHVWPFSQRDERIAGVPHHITYVELPAWTSSGNGAEP